MTEPILRPQSSEVLVPAGTIVTGRIVRMEHRLRPKKYFVVSMTFDRVQVDGKFFKLRVKSDGNTIFTPKSTSPDPEWPIGTFTFPARTSRYVIPAGFNSKWRTIASASTN